MPDLFSRIHRYLEDVTPQRPPVLRAMESYAADNDFPIIGPQVGRLLYQLALMIRARRILELGSGFGYSAYWFSLAVGSRGEIVLTDRDRANRRRALEYFRQGGLQSRFDFRVGDALRIARRLSGPFDIILNDIDKRQYPASIDLAAGLLKKGGLFITDNVIWSGKVCDRKPDETTAAIKEFTRALYADSRFFTSVIPLRDGLSLAVRM